MTENWAEAFHRIKAEVEAEFPGWDVADQYDLYRERCEAWKMERGYA